MASGSLVTQFSHCNHARSDCYAKSKTHNFLLPHT